MEIYTVGNREVYLSTIKNATNGRMFKLGKDSPLAEAGYPGGWAFLSIEDAQRMITEEGEEDSWDVFGLQTTRANLYKVVETDWWYHIIEDCDVLLMDEHKLMLDSR